MKIVNNDALIKRNRTLSQSVLYVSLGVLVVGLLWSLTNPEATESQFSYLILIPTYILVQLSIYLANRWGRSPRPDEVVAQSLKGLSDQYTLYNYIAGSPHLLAGPAGLLIIKPYYHSGDISYDSKKKRYKQKGGPFFLTKVFAQESLPDISQDSKNLLKRFNTFLQKNGIKTGIQPEFVNIFYSDKASVNSQDAPEAILRSEKLKDFVRGQAKKKTIVAKEIERLTSQFAKAT